MGSFNGIVPRSEPRPRQSGRLLAGKAAGCEKANGESRAASLAFRETGSISAGLSFSYEHPGNLNEARRVCQLKLPFDGMYSFTYQNVQSSPGSMLRLE